MIYLDNAATTRVKEEVAEKMKIYYCKEYANPSGMYEAAYSVERIIDEGRETFARILNCNKDEIYFTSGGTESDNWALKSAALLMKKKGKHIITTKIEHHAILNTCEFLESLGYEITYLNVGKNGVINVEELLKSIRNDTIIISVMTANNEIGTIQPIDLIGNIAREKGIIFHTDAVQAFAHIPIDVKKLKIDMLSASSHKFGGPKGCGFLYINKDKKIIPFIHGGGQEKGMRAGTTNVSGIIGMTEAAKEAAKNMRNRMAYEIRLRDYMINRISKEIPFSLLNGDRYKRLPNNVNFSLKNVEGQSVVLLLSDAGICASSGSACSAGEAGASHVLKALGHKREWLGGAIRFTLSHENTKEEIDFTIAKLKEIVYKLRPM